MQKDEEFLLTNSVDSLTISVVKVVEKLIELNCHLNTYNRKEVIKTLEEFNILSFGLVNSQKKFTSFFNNNFGDLTKPNVLKLRASSVRVDISFGKLQHYKKELNSITDAINKTAEQTDAFLVKHLEARNVDCGGLMVRQKKKKSLYEKISSKK
jgi:hypothetical protein